MWKSWPAIISRPLKLEFEIPTNRTQKFWDLLEKGEIHTTQCSKCGVLQFPPVGDCPECGSSKMNWIPLDGRGELEAFSHIIARPASFQHKEPYTIAVGELVDGIKVLAWLVDADISDIEVGLKIRLKAGKTDEGEPTYWFVPI